MCRDALLLSTISVFVEHRRAPGARRNTRAFGALLVVVLAANAPYLIGMFDADKLGPLALLASSVRPGPLAGGNTIDPNVGFASQALGHLSVSDLLHLRIPWWNPYEGLGTPLAGEMQAASFFPPTLLTGLANGQVYERLILELLAGWWTYRVLERLGARHVVCIFCGALFALNGQFAWFQHAPINTIPFLPLAVLGVEDAFAAAQSGAGGGSVRLAAAGAFSFIAGFPESTFLDFLFVALWALWRGHTLALIAPRTLIAYTRKLVCGAVCAMLSAAPLLIAFATYLMAGTSINGSDSELHVYLNAAIGLPALVLPYVYGPIAAFLTDSRASALNSWFTSVGGYLTTGPIFIALLPLGTRRHRGLQAILVLVICFTITRDYGLPLSGLVNLIPGMGDTVFSKFSWPILSYAVTILVGLGLERLASHRATWRAAAAGAVSVAIILAAAFAAIPIINALPARAHSYFWMAVASGAGVPLACLSAILIATHRVRLPAVGLLLLSGVGYSFVLPEFSAPRSVTLDLRPVSFLRAHLGVQRFFTLGPLAPNYGSYFRLNELDVDDAIAPRLFDSYVKRWLAPSATPPLFSGTATPSLLSHLNGYRKAAVSYVLTFPGTLLPERYGVTLVLRTPTTWIYRLSHSAPFYTVSAKCRTVASSDIAVTLRCKQPGTLLRREMNMPGASATIGSQPVHITQTGSGFQSVNVPTGTSRVVFSYSPPDIWIGWLAAVSGLCMITGTAWLNRRRPR